MSEATASERPAGPRRLGRSRSVRFGAVLVVLLGALVGVVAFGVRSFQDLTEEPSALEATGTSVVPPEAAAPRGVLVHQGADGGIVAVTMLLTAPDGGGHVVLVPVGSMVEVPSFGLNPLREAFTLGGLPLVRQSVENLVGLVFDRSAVVTAADLGALVAPAGALPVELGAPVEVVGETRRVEQVFPSGVVDVGPDRLGALLEQRGSGSDLDLLVRHQAFWQAWLAAIGNAPDSAPPADAADGVGGLVADLAAGDVGYHLLPVEALATGEGAGEGLYAVQADALDELMAEIAPGAAGRSSDRVRVQVLNGTGTPGLAQDVQPVLAPAGAMVALTGNADRFDHQTTQVVFYRDEDLDAARAVQRALGVGEVVRSLVALDVVDLTVVIGADFVARTTTTIAGPGA